MLSPRCPLARDLGVWQLLNECDGSGVYRMVLVGNEFAIHELGVTR